MLTCLHYFDDIYSVAADFHRQPSAAVRRLRQLEQIEAVVDEQDDGDADRLNPYYYRPVGVYGKCILGGK